MHFPLRKFIPFNKKREGFKKVKIAIVGYGRLGAACEKILLKSDVHSLAGIFTRRIESSVNAMCDRVYPLEKISTFKEDVDALLLCIGSRSDSFDISPRLAREFNIIDCFDTHQRSAEYLELVNKSALKGGKSAICMCGWDPGLLSQIRVIFSSLFTLNNTYTYWGKGVSQGHSEAVRRICGVKHAVCYTVPDEKAVRLSELGVPFSKDKLHRRECYVVASDSESEIEEKIKNMPDYFLGTETKVHFISETEFLKNHNEIYHRGRVIAADTDGTRAHLELTIPSNPQFTARVMIAYLSALMKMQKENINGARSVLDIPLSYLVDGIYNYI